MGRIKSVSIIGNGPFGKLVGSFMPKDVNYKIYGRGETIADTRELVKADAIVLAIPLDSYQAVLELLAPLLRPGTLIVDVCSVKTKPAALIASLLPTHKNVLLTHPLFGPQTKNDGRKHTLVITRDDSPVAKEAVKFCRDKLDLEVLHMTNEEHDKRMAEIHVLTFFIARGLNDLGLDKEPFMTPTFQSLLDLVAQDQSHSHELFLTIQNGNPFGAEERQRFIDHLQKINDSLE